MLARVQPVAMATDTPSPWKQLLWYDLLTSPDLWMVLDRGLGDVSGKGLGNDGVGMGVISSAL